MILRKGSWTCKLLQRRVLKTIRRSYQQPDCYREELCHRVRLHHAEAWDSKDLPYKVSSRKKLHPSIASHRSLLHIFHNPCLSSQRNLKRETLLWGFSYLSSRGCSVTRKSPGCPSSTHRMLSKAIWLKWLECQLYSLKTRSQSFIKSKLTYLRSSKNVTARLFRP